MSRSLLRHLLKKSPPTLCAKKTAAARPLQQCCHPFSHTTISSDTFAPNPASPLSQLQSNINNVSSHFTGNFRRPSLLDTNTISSDGKLVEREGALLDTDGKVKEITWQMHIYAHRHNVHITVARPPNWKDPVTGKVYGENPPHRSVAMSLSTGRLGFRKSGRKHYDSAFQLATYVMVRMQDSGINSQIEKLEVYLRGFGTGREAVTRVLLGVEGRHLRKKIVKVADATRLKIGGTRGRNPRRLG